MKILLAACNAKYIHSNLAVYDLKAYSSDYDEHVILREYTINQPKDEILKDIYSSGADVVCFSCYIWNISFVRELIRDLVKILPKTAFWAGGPEVSYDAEKFLTEMPEMTGVMVGEGEKTFHDLLEFYIDGKDSLEEISGIAYRTGDKIIHNGWRELMDLSAIPFVYEHLEKFENRIIYYESSRGCPFSCSYCLSSIDKKLRFRDLELVKKELQFFLDHRVPQVKFVDRTFNCKHEHAMTIWKYILEHDNGVTNFHFEISADLLREEEMELMSQMRPGLIQLEIGVQSTNPETIRAIHRHMDLKKLEHCVNRVHSFRNIHQHLDLIAGLPYEDYDIFHQSFNDVYQMKLNKGNRDISFDSLNSTDDFDSLVDYKEYLRNSDNIILFIKEDTEETEFLIKQLKYGINELNLPVIIVYLDFDIDIDDDCGFISGKREKIKNTIKHFNTSFQILHCAITFEMPFDKKAFWLVLNYLDLNKHISKHTHLSQSKRRLIDLILENILLS